MIPRFTVFGCVSPTSQLKFTPPPPSILGFTYAPNRARTPLCPYVNPHTWTKPTRMPRTPAKLQAIRLFGWAINLLDTGNFSGRGFMVSRFGECGD